MRLILLGAVRLVVIRDQTKGRGFLHSQASPSQGPDRSIRNSRAKRVRSQARVQDMYDVPDQIYARCSCSILLTTSRPSFTLRPIRPLQPLQPLHTSFLLIHGDPSLSLSFPVPPQDPEAHADSIKSSDPMIVADDQIESESRA